MEEAVLLEEKEGETGLLGRKRDDEVSCRSEDGSKVDWWILYKLPV